MYDENKSYSFSWINSDVDKLMLFEVVDEYLDAKVAQQLSKFTLKDYRHTLARFKEFLGDVPIADIQAREIRGFLATLTGLKKKTVRNYWVALSSLWTWSINEGYVENHVVRKVTPPKPDEKAILPFTREDITALMNIESRLTNRNRAIMYVLLDTGIRNNELCTLKLGDLDGNMILVRKGKGGKERSVPVSMKTLQILLNYITDRERDEDDYSPYLFPSVATKGRLRIDSLYHLLKKLGIRAGVVNVYPHRFRHTFAINYLRNGGDIFTLQKILGHTSLEMTKRYLSIARDDILQAHKKASPVKSMNL